MKGENKHIVKPSETSQKQERYSMQQFPIVLENAIMNWQTKMRKATGNNFFSAYHELSKLVDIAPSTLRSYTNEFDLVTPPVGKLILICKTIGDKEPLTFIHEYVEALFQ